MVIIKSVHDGTAPWEEVLSYNNKRFCSLSQGALKITMHTQMGIATNDSNTQKTPEKIQKYFFLSDAGLN